mmetsp:Transcript_3504/g.9381  ORF Transcript_3504/g.9381 Transcript_3504/m.9381 type:complete len:297 (+) Transcript_3504:1633-2523(+)
MPLPPTPTPTLIPAAPQMQPWPSHSRHSAPRPLIPHPSKAPLQAGHQRDHHRPLQTLGVCPLPWRPFSSNRHASTLQLPTPTSSPPTHTCKPPTHLHLLPRPRTTLQLPQQQQQQLLQPRLLQPPLVAAAARLPLCRRPHSSSSSPQQEALRAPTPPRPLTCPPAPAIASSVSCRRRNSSSTCSSRSSSSMPMRPCPVDTSCRAPPHTPPTPCCTRPCPLHMVLPRLAVVAPQTPLCALPLPLCSARCLGPPKSTAAMQSKRSNTRARSSSSRTRLVLCSTRWRRTRSSVRSSPPL